MHGSLKEEMTHMSIKGTVNFSWIVHKRLFNMRKNKQRAFIISSGDILSEKINQVEAVLPIRQQLA